MSYIIPTTSVSGVRKKSTKPTANTIKMAFDKTDFICHTQGESAIAFPDETYIADPINPTNLKLHYKFDEGTGTTAASSALAANTGTIHGATWVDGKLSKALSFGGTNDDYVETANVLTWFTDEFTMSAWINFVDYVAVRGIFTADKSSPNTKGLRIKIDTDGSVKMLMSGGSALCYIASGIITTNTWYHLAITGKGGGNSQTPGYVKAYVNGSPVSITYMNTTTVSSITHSGATATATATAHGYSNNDTVYISGATPTDYNGYFVISNVAANTFDYAMASTPSGNASGTLKCKKIPAIVVPSATAYVGADYTGPTENFKGIIDDFRLYNSALDDATINTIYSDIGVPPVAADSFRNYFAIAWVDSCINSLRYANSLGYDYIAAYENQPGGLGNGGGYYKNTADAKNKYFYLADAHDWYNTLEHHKRDITTTKQYTQDEIDWYLANCATVSAKSNNWWDKLAKGYNISATQFYSVPDFQQQAVIDLIVNNIMTLAAAYASTNGDAGHPFTFAGVLFDSAALTGEFTSWPVTGAMKVLDGDRKPVSTITRSGATATVTTTYNHGYANNDYVVIKGATQTEYNGKQQITYISPTSFSFPVSGTPASPATGTITSSTSDYVVDSITRSGATATVTIGGGHNYETNNQVTIAGAVQSEYNGVKTITVTGATTFTYTVSGSPASPATTSDKIYCSPYDHCLIPAGKTHDFKTYSDGKAAFFEQLRTAIGAGKKFGLEPSQIYHASYIEELVRHIKDRSDKDNLTPDIIGQEDADTNFVDVSQIYNSGVNITKNMVGIDQVSQETESTCRTIYAKAAINGCWSNWYGLLGEGAGTPHFQNIVDVYPRLLFIRCVANWDNLNLVPLQYRTWSGAIYQSKATYNGSIWSYMSQHVYFSRFHKNTNKLYIVFNTAFETVPVPAGKTVSTIKRANAFLEEDTDGTNDLTVASGLISLTSEPTTTITQAMTTTSPGNSGTLTVADGSKLPSNSPFVLLIESEKIKIASRSVNTLTLASSGARGYESTTAASHSNGVACSRKLADGLPYIITLV